LLSYNLETQKATYRLTFLLNNEDNIKVITFYALNDDQSSSSKGEKVSGIAHAIGNGYYETDLILDMNVKSYTVSARFEYQTEIKNQNFGFFSGYTLLNPQFSILILESNSDGTTYKIGPRISFTGKRLGIFEEKYILDGNFTLRITDSVSKDILYSYPFTLDEFKGVSQYEPYIATEFAVNLYVNQNKVCFTQASKLIFSVLYISKEGEERVVEIGTYGLIDKDILKATGNVN
jgi:hypothetical protein